MSLFDTFKCLLANSGICKMDYYRKYQNFDFLIPPAILLLTFYFSTFGLLFTIIFLFILLPVSFYILQNYVFRGNKINSFFYLSWTVSSFVMLMFIFEFVVVPFLEITVWENYTLLIFAFISLSIVLFLRYRNKCNSISVDNKPSGLMFYNQWIDANVPREHFKLYILSVLSAALCLYYFVYLSVTTICHTYIQFDLILVPDDCSEIYFDTNLSLSFVAALYSGILAVILTCTTIRLLYKLGKRDHLYNLVSSN